MRTKKLVASIAVIAGLTGGAVATAVPAIVTSSTATAGQPTKLPRTNPEPIPWPTPSTFPGPGSAQPPVVVIP